MSDFDKEAERQKLREKFDRDKEKRKETERMSQLLLQGATMTNRHCDTCGDPLFRYQGQVFCATCEGRAQEAEAEEKSDAQRAAAGSDTTRGGATVATGPVEETEGTEAAEPPMGERALDADATEHPTARVDSERGGDAEAAAGTSERANATVPTNAPKTSTPAERPASTSAQSGNDALADARASLIRTLTRHAQQAETADGPHRATEHLSAAREAAEALAALERGR